MHLFHVTSRARLPVIAAEGLKPRSYFAADEDLVAYYKETVEDEGGEPVVLAVDLRDLDAAHFEPDFPGIEEPITTVLGMGEDELTSSPTLP